MHVCVLSCVQLFANSWTIAHQAPLSMEFSRQEYWSGQPFPSPGDLPDLGIKSRSHALQADSLPPEPPMMACRNLTKKKILLLGQKAILYNSLLLLLLFSCLVVSDSLQPPGQNTGVGSHSLLQGIFPTQGSNPHLLHCRCILYQLSHQGSSEN